MKMSSQQQLLDIISVLNTNKKKEKLTGLENLKSLLKQETVVKTLQKNSKSHENTINWDVVFIKVHNAVLSLADETSVKSRNSNDKNNQIIHDVLFEILQKSTHEKNLLINSNLIVSSVLSVFESENRIRNLGSAYLNMLNKHVLSQRKNWSVIKEEYWIGIKNLCKTHYSNPPQGIQGSLFLEILIDVVRFSTKNCQISHKFLDLFDFLKEIFTSQRKSGSNFEMTLIRLTNTICLQLAVEFRFKVCEFMESVFDFMKSFHETQKQEKNILVYHFFMTTINIHNPNGLWDEKTFYAFDVKKWKSQIREIFLLCNDEIKLILKNVNKFDVEIDFLNLFVDVSYLFSGLENVPESYTSDALFDEPGPSNKRKLFDNVTVNSRAKQIKLEGSLKSLLKNLNSSDSWFWLKFMEYLLQKYPLSLQNEHCDFVEFLYRLISEKKNSENTKIAIRCLCSFFEVENSHANDLIIQNGEKLDDLWAKIATELIRSVSQENSPEIHSLMRMLINHSKFGDSEPLLKLFLNGTLSPCLENFKTLCSICQHCIIPESWSTGEKMMKNKEEKCEKVRVRLLFWLFQEDKSFPCKDLSKLLIALILKRFEEDIETTVTKEDTLISQKNINDFCKLITRNYLTVAFKNVKFVTEKNPIENNSQIRIESNMKYKLFDILISECEKRINLLKNDNLDLNDSIKSIGNGLWFSELLCHLLSVFEFTNDTSDRDFLNRLLESTLPLCWSRSLEISGKKFFDLGPFSNLYRGPFHPSVEIKVRRPEFINLDFLQFVFGVFKNGIENTGSEIVAENITSGSRFSQLIKNPQSILHFESLTKREKIIVNAGEMMCDYIATTDCNQYQNVLARKIMNVLTSPDFAADTSNFSIQLVLRIIFNFRKHYGITISILKSSLDLLETLCSSKHSDFEVIIMCLEILKDFTGIIKKMADPETHLKFIKLCQEMRNSIVVRKNCGVKTVLKFIECLAEISKMYLSGIGDALGDSAPQLDVFEDVITLLNHPYHEIRLTAAQFLGFFFVLSERRNEIVANWQKKLLKKLFEVLKNSQCRLTTKENGSIADYYDHVTSSICLMSWASVICLSANWRKKALFYLIHISFIKKFKHDDVKNVLSLVCKELKIGTVENYVRLNFFYLCYKWLKKGLPIEDFPKYLLNYKKIEEFFLNFFPDVAVAYAELGHVETIKKISVTINKPLGTLLENSHSQLLAFILPNLSENANYEKMKNAQKVKRFLDEEVGSKSTMQWLTRSLDKIIYNMIRNMSDTSYLLSLCEFSGNVKNDKRLRYGASHVEETLEKLRTIGDKPLLGKVAVEKPWMIEKILRRLLKNVHRAAFPEEKVFALYKYIFFVESMGKVTQKESIYSRINAFFIRDVVYSLAGILKKNQNETITEMCCVCYGKLSEFYSKEFGSILGEFLPAITTTLTPIVRTGNRKGLDVLRVLICENRARLESHIALLDFFPPEKLFADINEQIERTRTREKNLKNGIKHFINVGRSKNSGCRLEGLKNLHEMLSTEKNELREMYDELKSLRGFSEDCENSLLHRLICMLVELTSEENTAVRIEAAKCLGELGPSDLRTLVLRPENNFDDTKMDIPPINRLLQTAINNLLDLIVSDCYEVKKAASKALYAVLSTREGRESCEKNTKYLEYLTPFISKSGESFQLGIKSDVFLKKLGESESWRPRNHEKWVANLLEGLLQSLKGSSEVIETFLKLIRVNWQFGESLLPVILLSILSLNVEKINEAICRNISAFFEENFHHKNKRSTSVDKTSVRCFLSILDYVRMQRNHEGECHSFGVNFLHVAKAALFCSAFFTSIFYAELWFEDKRFENHQNVDINVICECFPDEGFALGEILRECHFKIGNLDGVHGCGYTHILNPASEIQHYEHLKNWSLSLLHNDIALSQGNFDAETGLFRSLERSGMFYTLNNLMKNRDSNGELTSIRYKCAARLSDWSQLESTHRQKNSASIECFDKCFYFALKAFHDGDVATFQNETQKARKCVLSELTHCSLESSKNLYLPISELQSLTELEEFAESVASSQKSQVESLFEKWEAKDSIKCSEFKLVESILTNRTILIKDAIERAEDEEMKESLQRMLCRIYHKLTTGARKEKKYETAIRTINYFQNVKKSPKDLNDKMELEKARVLWERGDKEIGRFLLNHFLKKNNIENELKSKSLRIYGDWMAKTKSENSREIIENYYVKSIEESSRSRGRIHSYYSLAKFADCIYDQLNEYLSSPLFEIKQNLFNTQQDLASELRQELGRNDENVEKKMAYVIASKQSAIDENEIKNCKIERDSYLTTALKYYLLSLREGENYNLVVFRIISLWLSNSSNHDVIQQLQKYLHHIPTYKFLCLLPQLVPRMADVCLISDLIEKILQDHPHHTLPLLFALSNSYEDLKYNGSKTTITNPRVLAAKSILGKFSRHKKLEKMILEMRKFSTALIELANHNPPIAERSKLGVKFADHLQIKHIKGLTSVSVPSIQIPQSKNCDYEGVTGVHRFEETYHLVGGINMPKRVTCLGTDGVGRALLVKGKDDLRQDAVMQQVFTIMNSLLYRNEETSKRKLIIRTYKVVPLSQRSGVIEWCENTQPLSLYLTGPDGKSGAHKKFYKNDTSAYDCRVIIREAFAQPQVTNEEKLKVFLNVCRQIHPVFRYFFMEKFPAAGVWFERRLAYIHSVATSSMIGYILGIGDRHVYNILIDNTTAEVIHIDLGIAFEQGKTLRIPETVPFRLTRDIVDGMGLSGVEGDFRISCVKTMEVLRENQDTILTLLEVLLYDPLYAWTITPEKAYTIQNQSETSSSTTEKSSPDLETNKMAERALIRLKQKLEGTEAGFGGTNVEGQVSYLIQQARDPNNLCRLFHGWQAYL